MSQKSSPKMCKVTTKNQSPKLQKPLPQELATPYETLNTNCTMVGSNNLNLDTKLGQNQNQPQNITVYSSNQLKMGHKPLKSPEHLIRKPHSPRNLQLDGMAPQGALTQKYTSLRNIQSPTQIIQNLQGLPPLPGNFNPKMLFDGTHGVVKSVGAPPQSPNNVIQSRINTKPTNTTFTASSPGAVNNGVGLCSMSPSAYSNPSPSSYPNNSVSPYSVQISSPANSVSSVSGVQAIKSPVASPQNIRPPTPQPLLPQTFQQIPVMTSGQNLVQIIHAGPNNPPNYQNHSVIARQTIIAPSTQNIQQQPLIKIKPPQNILPKPPSSGAQPSNAGKAVSRAIPQQNPAAQPLQNATNSAQIVLPNQAILPTAQHGTLLLNQMPLMVQQNPHGVQLILRPSTPNSGPQLTTTGKIGGPQNLILQPGPGGGAAGPQVILQHAGGQRGAPLQQPQQLVRVLTANGMIQPITQTYIAMNNQLNLQQLTQAASQSLAGPPPPQPAKQPTQNPQLPPPQQVHHQQAQSTQLSTQTSHLIASSSTSQTLHTQNMLNVGSCLPLQGQNHNVGNMNIEQSLPPPKRKPKKKKKSKEKLDLGSIMKLSGIGDDDDVLFESDASESALTSDHISCATTLPQITPNKPSVQSMPISTSTESDYSKRINNLHITNISTDANHQKLNLTDKTVPNFTANQISVQQSLSDINAINQNLTQIGLINQNTTHNYLNSQNLIQTSTNTQSISNLSTVQGVPTVSNIPITSNHENQSLANFLQALNSQNFSLINSPNISFPSNASQPSLPTLQNQKFPVLSSVPNSSSSNFPNSLMSSIITTPNANQDLNMSKNVQKTLQNVQSTHFNLSNLSNTISNLQLQNICANNPNLILNQGATNTIITPNIPNFPGNITINNGLIPNTNLALPNTNLTLPNFLPNLVQQSASEVNNFSTNNLQRTGGFKLALSEDGRLILQHDPNLNQDIQSQLLLQNIFGINLQGGNLVLTSVSSQLPQTPKPMTVSEPIKKPLEQTKTTNIIQNVIPSVKVEPQPIITPPIIPNPEPPPPPPPPQPLQQLNNNNNAPQNNQTPPNNFSYIINLTPDQLETLKRNGQLNVNGQTIFMHRPKEGADKNVSKSPKGKTPKRKSTNMPVHTQFEHKLHKPYQLDPIPVDNLTSQSSQTIHKHLNIPNIPQMPLQANQTIINHLQSPRIHKTITSLQSANSVINSATNITDMIKTSQSTPNLIFSPPKPSPIENKSHLIENHLHHQQISKSQPSQVLQITHTPAVSKVPQIPQAPLIPQVPQIVKQKPPPEPLIILQPQKLDKKLLPPNMHQESVPKEVENIFHHPTPENPQINVEQFLSNLNINSANLGQLISQKLNQELPNVDHKIVNITPSSTGGHIVAKIDLKSENLQQMLTANSSSEPLVTPSDAAGLMLPPLVSMKESDNVQISQQPTITPDFTQNQLPALIIGGNMLPSSNEPPPVTSTDNSTSTLPSGPETPIKSTGNTVYQRIQTIQLTPQNQQLLKSVQLKIQALTNRLQQKSLESIKKDDQISENEIHSALRNLFIEQQKILATGKILPTIQQPLAMEPSAPQPPTITKPINNPVPSIQQVQPSPVVSQPQNQKVYYHHGNQIIAINQNMVGSSAVSSSSAPTVVQQNPNLTVVNSPTTSNIITSTVASTSVNNTNPQIIHSSPNLLTVPSNVPCQTVPSIQPASVVKLSKKPANNHQATVTSNSQVNIPQNAFLSPNKSNNTTSNNNCAVQTNEKSSSAPQLVSMPDVKPSILVNPVKPCAKTLYSKLIEQQLTTDQNGANNPDISTPFLNKADACKRLVRYHCYNQPVLSQKDLNKADEIFELTANHFIDKFRMMVNKYKFLLFKEGMREVQTSELMMIDRMFLAEEQQSYIKLQSDVKLQCELEEQENLEEIYKQEHQDKTQSTNSDTDIKPNKQDIPISECFNKEMSSNREDQINSETVVVKSEQCDRDMRYDDSTNTDFNIKLNYFSDGSCDSTNFRVYEDSPKEFSEFISSKECYSGEKAREKIEKNIDCHRSSKNSGMESYNTTKIIGNFEIEINNKGCNAQESYTKNFRQKIIDNKMENCKKDPENSFNQKESDEYDEWLCIQRELGYYNDTKPGDNDQKSLESTSELSTNSDSKPNKLSNEDLFKKGSKRNNSDTNRLETLKKFRVEKHNSKSKKSIIGEVKFEVRIEHKKVFAEQNKLNKNTESVTQPQNSLKRTQCFDYNSSKPENSEFNVKRLCQNQNFKAQNEVVQSSCTSCHSTVIPTSQIKQEDLYLDDLNSLSDPAEDQFDRSIDEQVQSAIDSILNLQQISSMNEKNELEPRDSSKQCAKGVKTDDFRSLESFSDSSETLDEAVKSILS